MISAKEFEGELWIKASDYHRAIKTAQRPWVGLTQKEVQEIHDTYYKRMGPQEFAKAIEQALEERNHGT